MFCQPGQPFFSGPGSEDSLGEAPSHDAPQDSGARPAEGALPSFLSASPPRSEGEALLRRIFSRHEGM